MDLEDLILEQTILEQAMDNLIQTQPTSDPLPSHWAVVRLGEVGTICGGSTPSTKIPDYWGGEILWLTPSEVTKCEGLFISQTDRSITKEGLANCSAKLLPVGTVMMTSRATIGEVVINAVPMVTNQGFININCDDEKVFNEFLAYWIKQNKPKIDAYANGVTFREVSKSNFKNITASLPPLPQQRAIAKLLRAAQEAIQVRRDELELEREHKAALMEYLFTHGTKRESTKQTKIGEIPQCWAVVKVGDVVTLQRGFDITRKEQKVGKIPVVSSSGILSYHDTAKIKGPGVIIGRKGSLGTVFYVGDDYWPHDTTLWVKDFHKNDPKFVYYFLRSLNLKQFDVGSSNPTLNRNHVHTIQAGLPELSEQREIAKILTACDKKISFLELATSLLEELFCALLEELMTGRLSTLSLVEEGETHE